MRKELLFIITLLSGGCCVGTNFSTPAAPEIDTYGVNKLPQETVSASLPLGGVQKFAWGEGTKKEWWKAFGCKKLDAVIETAMQNSPTLEAAQDALIAAREDVNAQAGSVLYPQAGVSFGSSRQKLSTASSGHFTGELKPFDLHHAGISVNYLFDIFGGGRRSIEALRAQVDYQSYKLKAVRLALAANVVNTAAEEASLRAQKKAIEDIIVSQEKQLSMLQAQFSVGGAAKADVLLQQARVEENRALLPAYEKSLSLVRSRLAVLCGKFPAQAAELAEFTMSDFKLPQELPVKVPSLLVRARPDICASEALLHAACARAGVAEADLYPSFVLNGSYGSQSNALKDIFDSNKDVWSFGYALAQPVIDGGSRRAKRRGAQALYEQAAAQYREVLLNAFANVADSLAALESDAKALKAQAQAERASYDSYDVVMKQYKVGGVSYDVVLNADRQYQQALTGRIKAQAQRLYDSAALFQAMGYGEE